MSIVVTGGAGFIGSCLVRTLNDMGIEDILIIDDIGETEKWKNLVNKKYLKYIHKTTFLEELKHYSDVTHILHMGACSSTTEVNFDYLYKNNLEYSKTLWKYCAEKKISFIYASSAATYGDGRKGFCDGESRIEELEPLNGYGYSKQLFDLWVKKQSDNSFQHVGLKFFNVYGPNEYCKGRMASVILHGFRQIKESGKIKLFKSYKPEYMDGGQLRDFIYIMDICKVIQFFMQHKEISGLFNVGTGCAESFEKLALSIFHALDIRPDIEYIEMPEKLQAKYQYYTQADIQGLRKAGYNKSFYDLEKGVYDYVCNFLDKDEGCLVY